MPESTVLRLEQVRPPKSAQPIHVLTIEVATLVDGPGLDELRQHLDQLHADFPRLDILIDLSGVEILSSPAIGLLGMEHRRTWNAKGRMKLCCVGPTVMQVFTITRLDGYFDIFPTRDEALASF